jgi:hypothetical protein
MKTLGRFIAMTHGCLLFAVAALLVGCSGLQPSTGAPGAPPLSGKATGLTPLGVQREMALTMAHYVQRSVHPSDGRSWMLPQKKKSVLIYAVGSSGVNVYDYSNGKLVGTLSDSGAYGGCVDAKGDIYIGNFDDQDVVEYAHGGTKILNTYEVSGGTPIGCSVDSKGDLAVTSFDPGEVEVFAGGNPSKGTLYSGGSCYYLWSMGYDHSGNLIGVGENEDAGREYCGLLFGGSSITTLSFSGTIDFAGGTMWDGKYIALGDQEAGGTYATGVYPSTLSGSILTPVSSEIDFTDTCYSDYTDIVNPFILGKKNTPVNDTRGTVMVGFNQWCEDGGSGGGISLWHYPAGGNPFKTYTNASGAVLGVSIGT